jgi:predicted aspartyl protease
VEIHDVDALVAPRGALATSLLGMSALNRLGKVEIADRRLILRQ